MKTIRFCLLVISMYVIVSGSLTLAQRPDAADYAVRGPYTVGTQELVVEDDIRPLNVTIWYPADGDKSEEDIVYSQGFLRVPGRAIEDATPYVVDGPYPLVLFSHGNAGTRWQSLWLTEHLASYGFVVMSLDHPGNTVLDRIQDADGFNASLVTNYVYRPTDLVRLVDFAEGLNTSGSTFAGLIDVETVAAAGHSFGGYTALAAAGARLNFDQLQFFCDNTFDQPEITDGVCLMLEFEANIAAEMGLDALAEGAYPAITDDRIDAVIALAPWNGPILDQVSLAELDMPSLIMVGTNDQTTPPTRDAYLIYQGMTQSPKVMLTFGLADHFIHVDTCFELALQAGFFQSCSDPVWDMQRAHDIMSHTATLFLLTTLKQDVDALRQLSADELDFAGVDFFSSQLAALDPTTRIPRIVDVFPHDTGAWTQGLLLHDGLLYESTGLNGRSSLREVDPQTGEVLRQVDLDDAYFGEGLALVDDRLIQLTWRAEVAFIYDLETFEPIGTFSYEGEGWGLCYDGTSLYMSNGSSTITERDPDSFEIIRSISVNDDSGPVANLNELECVNADEAHERDVIYANVWQTDRIVVIDKETGDVLHTILADASLYRQFTPEERSAMDVFNGIAYDPENRLFYITGKFWPRMFYVTLTP